MRFAILAAVAALGTSAPAAAATWLFSVTATFDYTKNSFGRICGELTPSCYAYSTDRQLVDHTYFVSVPDSDGVYDLFEFVSSFAGDWVRWDRSYIKTRFQIEGNAMAATASVNTEYYGCSGDIQSWEVGCSDFQGSGDTVRASVNFVRSEGGPGPVPEPTTWALMIAGFGMVGGSMRYRRRKTTVAFT